MSELEEFVERLKAYIDIYKEREEGYKPMCTIDEYKRCEGAIYAFDEVLALINELKEEFE